MKINEIVFSNLLEPTEAELEKYQNGNEEFIQVLAGYELWLNKYPNRNQEIYFYLDEEHIVGYAKVELKKHSTKKSFWWLMEIWIKDDPEYRRKGMAGALVRFIKDNKKILIIDDHMSPEAYNLITKMIHNGNVLARIYNTKIGDAEEYHPGEDIIDDPNKVFILEDYCLREGILNKMTVLNYLDTK